MDVDNRKYSEKQWVKQMPMEKTLDTKMILDTRVAKNTRWNKYLEKLVKWKGHPVKDSTWMNVASLQKEGYYVEYLMRRR